ncbi:MAG TPA: UDP-N-acetylmuramate dehydrogenase [Chitinophagaceae bacterium]|nr:UDP-N-acetylmuramate dehydrogenase [Chitinophagaceae bacterium]HRG91525.1 UDP-N-acetylmuramate dehydrogenase [Chitinophagaceae bacterium]
MKNGHLLVAIQENISLKPYNSFGIDAQARYFASFTSEDELGEIVAMSLPGPVLVLGGGSNLLFTRDFNGLVLKNEIHGITELHEDSEYVYVRAGAGENWHQFVQYSIGRGWAGAENLSLIPGNVGATPMQNIGAYGVEIEDIFWDLEAFHINDKRKVTFTNADCEFGYRESVFKKKYRDQFVILNVTYRLRKHPRFNTSYGAIETELEKMGIKELSLKSVSQAVINIRRSKLPDPLIMGNAGSFFKNPEITIARFEQLRTAFPDIVAYPLTNGNIKLAAGWLIENCGPQPGISWKGFRRGSVGCHERQALVLVNYGHASGQEVYQFSEEIVQRVNEVFGITLEREVNII